MQLVTVLACCMSCRCAALCHQRSQGAVLAFTPTTTSTKGFQCPQQVRHKHQHQHIAMTCFLELLAGTGRDLPCRAVPCRAVREPSCTSMPLLAFHVSAQTANKSHRKRHVRAGQWRCACAWVCHAYAVTPADRDVLQGSLSRPGT